VKSKQVTQNMIFLATLFAFSMAGYLIGPAKIFVKTIIVGIFIPYVSTSIFFLAQLIQFMLDFDIWNITFSMISGASDIPEAAMIVSLSLNYVVSPMATMYSLKRMGFYDAVDKRLGIHKEGESEDK